MSFDALYQFVCRLYDFINIINALSIVKTAIKHQYLLEWIISHSIRYLFTYTYIWAKVIYVILLLSARKNGYTEFIIIYAKIHHFYVLLLFHSNFNRLKYTDSLFHLRKNQKKITIRININCFCSKTHFRRKTFDDSLCAELSQWPMFCN